VYCRPIRNDCIRSRKSHYRSGWKTSPTPAGGHIDERGPCGSGVFDGHTRAPEQSHSGKPQASATARLHASPRRVSVRPVARESQASLNRTAAGVAGAQRRYASLSATSKQLFGSSSRSTVPPLTYAFSLAAENRLSPSQTYTRGAASMVAGCQQRRHLTIHPQTCRTGSRRRTDGWSTTTSSALRVSAHTTPSVSRSWAPTTTGVISAKDRKRSWLGRAACGPCCTSADVVAGSVGTTYDLRV
jgi:hypothetical protein